MDAYQTLVARLQEKYRARDGAVSALLDEGVPGKLLARARKMRRRLADNLCMPGPAVATDAKVTARLQQDGYAIENVIITDDTGYAIPVNLYLPDAEPGPHPAVVVSMGHWPGASSCRKTRYSAQTLPAAASSPLHTTPSVRASALPSASRNLSDTSALCPRISKRWIFTCRRAI